MSELIDNASERKDLLEHLIRRLHAGDAPDAVRRELLRVLGQVPYEDVVEVEQRLMASGMPVEEVQRLCDLHVAVMQGALPIPAETAIPAGHPLEPLSNENRGIAAGIAAVEAGFEPLAALDPDAPAGPAVARLLGAFRALRRVERHYQWKENVLFPTLERHGITGPPRVMWGKDDEVRELLGGAIEALEHAGDARAGEVQVVLDLALRPAVAAMAGMVEKEERILFPMCLDTFTDAEWDAIAAATAELGYAVPARPLAPRPPAPAPAAPGAVGLPTGTLTHPELLALLRALPVDLTFVGADDTVRWFSDGPHRVFVRSSAVIGRKVQLCHPASSVHVVERILQSFKSGVQNTASFWIQRRGRFVSIEYVALRDEAGAYLGTLEVTQDLTEKRALEGERRLLEPEEATHA